MAICVSIAVDAPMVLGWRRRSSDARLGKRMAPNQKKTTLRPGSPGDHGVASVVRSHINAYGDAGTVTESDRDVMPRYVDGPHPPSWWPLQWTNCVVAKTRRRLAASPGSRLCRFTQPEDVHGGRGEKPTSLQRRFSLTHPETGIAIGTPTIANECSDPRE